MEEDFKDKLKGLKVVMRYPDLLKTIPIWGLENLIKIGIEYEEYESCDILKKEIDNRK